MNLIKTNLLFDFEYITANSETFSKVLFELKNKLNIIMICIDKLNISAILIYNNNGDTVMNNFEFWLNNVADIPAKTENGWVDHETGLGYDASVNYEKDHNYESSYNPSKVANYKEKIAERRQLAKFFGGKAIKNGSQKQKLWAEDIRKGVIENIENKTLVEYIVQCDDLLDARFWIDNRNTVDARYFESRYEQIAEDSKQTKTKHDASTVGKIQKKLKIKSLREANVDINKAVERALSDTNHKHTELESKEIDGVIVRIFDIPTLSKKLYLAKINGKTHQGYSK